MRVRLAGPDDGDVIVELLADVEAAFGEAVTAHESRERRVHSALALPEVGLEFLLAVDGDAVAGMVSVTTCPTTQGGSDGPNSGTFAWIDDLYVRPAHRGRGLGAELLRSAARRARQRGAVEARLAVDGADAALVRLHCGAGFLHRGQALLVHDLREDAP